MPQLRQASLRQSQADRANGRSGTYRRPHNPAAVWKLQARNCSIGWWNKDGSRNLLTCINEVAAGRPSVARYQPSDTGSGAVKDILFHVDSYPDPTPVAAIDQAVRFAATLGSGITALAVQVDFKPPGNWLAERLVNLSARRALPTARQHWRPFRRRPRQSV